MPKSAGGGGRSGRSGGGGRVASRSASYMSGRERLGRAYDRLTDQTLAASRTVQPGNARRYFNLLNRRDRVAGMANRYDRASNALGSAMFGGGSPASNRTQRILGYMRRIAKPRVRG